jgi:iron complex transport system ATP-binding protein
VDLDVEPSEILGLVGPNGSGKTTLIKCIDRILKPAGSILLDDVSMEDMSRLEIARRIGYVPQQASTPHATTVFDAVLMGRRPHITWKVSETDLDRVAEILELLDLGSFALREIGCLSGGQRQKVLIARALCQDPGVILLDEPTSSLDMKHQLDVMQTIRQLVDDRRISAVIAIHDLNLASRFVDKLAVLKDGIVCAAGSPSDLLSADLIRDVYGVEAVIMNDFDRPYVIALRSLNGGLACD